LNWFHRLRIFLFFSLEIIALAWHPYKNILHFPGVKIGIEENELGIEFGETCMLFGKVVYNFKTQELKMPNPLIIMKEKYKI